MSQSWGSTSEYAVHDRIVATLFPARGQSVVGKCNFFVAICNGNKSGNVIKYFENAKETQCVTI